MFCNPDQETTKETNCEERGTYGDNRKEVKLDDVLIYTLKGIAEIVIKEKIDVNKIDELNHEISKSLLMTITNANFNEAAIEAQIIKMINLRKDISEKVVLDALNAAASFEARSKQDMLNKVVEANFKMENEQKNSLTKLIVYGLKGIAANVYYAYKLGLENKEIYKFIYKALADTLEDTISIEDLMSLTVQTGKFGLYSMALLDEANTSKYGDPEVTKVNIDVNDQCAILISGHDLTDLEQLLEQTKDTGVDVYTHGEMLAANYYPKFKQYKHLVGNYGGSWREQRNDFTCFNGPILLTSNCIIPPENEQLRSRIFTTGVSGYAACKHIESDNEGNKDYSEIIAMAKTLKAPKEIDMGSVVGGFAHQQFFEVTDRVVEAVKSGAIKKFVVMAGCDGAMKSSGDYTNIATELSEDTIILTVGCAKYRFNKMNLGHISGIPRMIDAGQCNDSYSLALIALRLKEVFEYKDINELPIEYHLSWYGQKSVIVLLSLLYLGIKDIHLCPTRPAFLTDKDIEVLTKSFNINTAQPQ
jgi:hydroxylamine reductase